MKKPVILTFLTITILFSFLKSGAQVGGNSTYEFLNLTNSARMAALGGSMLPVNDNDVTIAQQNPSLINESMKNHLALSYTDFYSDINYGFVSYGRSLPKLGNYVATMQYINYGTFKRADETGEQYGEFTAGEFAMNIGWGRSLDSNFSIGANFKGIYSSFDEFNSFGLAVDVAGSYHKAASGFTASLIFKNIGMQIDPYYSGNREPLPFEIQMGLSKRLKHLPFRYYIVLTNLQKWDLTYEDPQLNDDGFDPFTGEQEEKSGVGDFADNAMRHVVVGGELMFSKNFSLRLGYNYQRRQELKVDTKAATVGFSWGFGFRIKSFQFSYARSTYHLAGSPNYITIATDLSAL